MQNETNTQSLITLPKDVATAIENYLANHSGDKNRFLCAHCDDGIRVDENAPLNLIDSLTLASALVNGYQVEKSPAELEAERKEKVREFYEDLRRSSEGSIYAYKAEAVVKTLDLLGIQIEGVNE